MSAGLSDLNPRFGVWGSLAPVAYIMQSLYHISVLVHTLLNTLMMSNAFWKLSFKVQDDGDAPPQQLLERALQFGDAAVYAAVAATSSSRLVAPRLEEPERSTRGQLGDSGTVLGVEVQQAGRGVTIYGKTSSMIGLMKTLHVTKRLIEVRRGYLAVSLFVCLSLCSVPTATKGAGEEATDMAVGGTLTLLTSVLQHSGHCSPPKPQTQAKSHSVCAQPEPPAGGPCTCCWQLRRDGWQVVRNIQYFQEATPAAARRDAFMGQPPAAGQATPACPEAGISSQLW